MNGKSNMRQTVRRMLFERAHRAMSVYYSGESGLAVSRRVRRKIARVQAKAAWRKGPDA